MLFIRTAVFRVTQTEMATIAGCAQASVSRWESGRQEPNRAEMDNIRREARARGLTLLDAWFFDVPKIHEAA